MNAKTVDTQQQLSPCDVAALQRCLKDNKGDREKCLKEITAFQQACSKVEPAPAKATPHPPAPKP